ncbi:MAG: hypothetical protein RJA34_379 [Pseudomonadota bacterium]
MTSHIRTEIRKLDPSCSRHDVVSPQEAAFEMALSVQWRPEGVSCIFSFPLTLADIQSTDAAIADSANATRFRYLIYDFTQAMQLQEGMAALLMFYASSKLQDMGIRFDQVAIVSDDEQFPT